MRPGKCHGKSEVFHVRCDGQVGELRECHCAGRAREVFG